MDIPEKDPNESDEQRPPEQIPEIPADDQASNMEEKSDDDDISEATWQLLQLSIHSVAGDRTPTDPGTGQPLFNEPPPIPRIKELRRETVTSPPVKRRSSKKLDFPPEATTPVNSPEKMSPEVTADKPSTFGEELYVSLPGTSAEALKRRTSPTFSADPFYVRLMGRPILGRPNLGQSEQSPNLGLEGSDSQGPSNPNLGLGESQSQGQSTASGNPFPTGLKRRRPSQDQSAQSPNLGLDGSDSQGPSNPNLGLGESHSQGQSSQSLNLGLGGSQTPGQANPNLRLISTAAQDFTRHIMSDAIPESLAVGSNVVLQQPTMQKSKRPLEKSPSESGPSGSPSVVKRHRRVHSTVPEAGPAADVQHRRRLSYEGRGNEPEVRREPRKRSYSSRVEQPEKEEGGQKKGKRKAGDKEERLI